MQGNVSLENNGGFSSVRTRRLSPLDLSGAEGLALRVKGDGRKYQLRLGTDARYRGVMAVSFKAEFETKRGEWMEIRVPFSAFKGSFRGRSLPKEKLDPANIERLGLLLGDNAHLFGNLLDDSERAEAMRRFHEEAAVHFDTTCVPTPDGILIGIKR